MAEMWSSMIAWSNGLTVNVSQMIRSIDMISVNTNVNSHVDYIGYVTPVRLGLAVTLPEDVQTAERASRSGEVMAPGGVIAPACAQVNGADGGRVEAITRPNKNAPHREGMKRRLST
jgi:hypothetical protein